MANGHETILPGGVAHGHDPHHAPHAHHPKLQHHFYSMEQQLEASILGMWIFLVTEIMFFGGLFLAYIVYRTMYPEAWVAGSNHLNVYMGGANTLVLICSSVTMVLAVRAAQVGSRKGQVGYLIATIIFGSIFLIVKYFEYAEKFEHHLVPGPHFDPTLAPAQQIFFALYFIMTGIHALHMVVGIGIMLVILWMAWKGTFTPDYYGPIEVSGLYWHFVDIVWIFLFPLLYLLGFHYGH
ncbi:MAG TPA: cytochrome c oxidase subunit 3 family protein [Vicinamibacterales bacterium]|nr:cytochrome c oxidase subunit 3 family protein [Vicinamibacterales bacterium]